MQRECLNDSCGKLFFSEIKDYEACPECSSATIPTSTRKDIEKQIFEADTIYTKESIELARYGHFFKCPFGRECLTLGHYEPCCEQRLFRHECLIPVHHNQHVLEWKLDKILDHLNLNNQ